MPSLHSKKSLELISDVFKKAGKFLCQKKKVENCMHVFFDITSNSLSFFILSNSETEIVQYLLFMLLIILSLS